MDIDNILTLIQAVSDSKLTDFEYKDGDIKLILSKAGTASVQTVVSEPLQTVLSEAQTTPVSQTGTAEAQTKDGKEVKSPLVGTFYAAPAEDAEPYVKVGDKVTKGQVLAVVEAMKLMNEIECDYNGEVAEILVENGEMVEYGQPLFVIK